MTSVHDRGVLYEKWSRLADVPLLVLAVAVLPLLIAPAFFTLPEGLESTFVAIDWFIWAAFALDYLVRLVLAPRRWHFVTHHLIDLALVVLPFLRPLRILRSTRALRVLRLARAATFASRMAKDAHRVLVRYGGHYVLLVTALVVTFGAALVTVVESDGAEGNITNFGDALWWAITTVTTVGYGDHYPLTAAGRGIGALLMFVGITLFGVLTASGAAFFIGRDKADAGPTADEKLDMLLARLASLEVEIARLREHEQNTV